MSLADKVKPRQRFDNDGVVIDIGGSNISRTMKLALETRLLRPSSGARPLLPTALLYNDYGMRLWEKITHLPNYYQTATEIRLLELHAKAITCYVGPGSVLLDTGSGESRKIQPLLNAIEAAQIPVKYFALDLSKPALERSTRELAERRRFVQSFGLWGTFDDAWKWADKERQQDSPIWYISLGSFFGNDHFDAAVERLKAWRMLMRPKDHMLLGLDGQENATTVWASYHDQSDTFGEFMRNGLRHSNTVLGHRWFKEGDWEIQGMLEEGPPVTHKFVFQAIRDVVCEQLCLKFAKGDKIDCFEVFKYGPNDMSKQFAATGLKELLALKAPNANFYDYLLKSDCFISASKVKAGPLTIVS